MPSKDSFLYWTDTIQLQNLKTAYYEKISTQATWNPKQELLRFAYQNALIVLWTCLTFLKESFNFQFKLFKDSPNQYFLHPFSHLCTTISSYSYKLLLMSSFNNVPLYSSNKSLKSYSDRVSRAELEFCEFMSWKFPDYKFIHAFNSVTGQKKFGIYSIDLYSPESKEAYFFHGCWSHTHTFPECKEKKRCNITKDTATTLNSLRNYAEAKARDEELINYLINHSQGLVKSIKFIYQCEWEIFKKTKDYNDFFQTHKTLLQRPLQRLEPAVANRGGLLDVYNLHWSSSDNLDESFEFLDLNSIYTYISIVKKFPIDRPIVVVGNELNRLSIKKDGIYFDNIFIECGFIFCQVLPPSNLEIPFLQYRIRNNHNQHVVLANCKSCAELKKVKCCHRSLNSKAFTTTYTIPEINFAIKHLNYSVTAVYECHIFLSSEYVLKDFFSKMASLRLENSYDQSLNKESYCSSINNLLQLPENFKLDPSKVCYNFTKQSIIKLSLNSVIGKFSANYSNCRETVIINSQKILEEKTRHKKIFALELLNDFSVLVTLDSAPRHFPRNVNVYIGSHISAYARIYLYKKILMLKNQNCTLYYLDTDALAFSKPKDTPSCFNLTPYLGDFKAVLGAQAKIKQFYSLGQRNYCFVFENDKNEIEFLIKCKGLCLKHTFSKLSLTPAVYHNFITQFMQEEISKLEIKQLRLKLKSNTLPKEVCVQKYSFTNRININRIILKNCTTLPYGYKVNK